MQNHDQNNKTAESWDAYWQGDGSSHAYSSSGVNHAAISQYWRTLLERLVTEDNTSTMVDLASGNGALPELAIATFGETDLEISALDVSSSAIENIKARMPSVKGIVADAEKLPSAIGEFDLVTSQFGIEYAGLNAINAAHTLVAPGGLLALMIHCKDGAIERECRANLRALQQLMESQFVEHSRRMFEHGFAAVAGHDRKPYDEAAGKLGVVLPKIESIIKTEGEDIAGGLVVRLYNDVGKIHSRMPHYRPEDVLPWLTQMAEEVDAYSERMRSMLNAAIGEDSFNAICDNLQAAGFSLHTREALMDPQKNQPLAWVLQANRSL